MTTTTIAVAAGIAASGAMFAFSQTAPQGLEFDIVKELSGLGAFFILVFLIGRRLYGSTDKLTERVVAMAETVTAMEHAISTNTEAQNRVAAALEAFAEQQVAANKATVESQNHLADRNLKESMSVLTKMDSALVRIIAMLADQRRGARGIEGAKGRRGDRERRTRQ